MAISVGQQGNQPRQKELAKKTVVRPSIVAMAVVILMVRPSVAKVMTAAKAVAMIICAAMAITSPYFSINHLEYLYMSNYIRFGSSSLHFEIPG